MGRYTFLEAYNLTYDDLLNLHEECMHIDQLANDLEVSKKTLVKHLKKAGVEEIKYKPRKKYKKTSKLAKWVREHPEESLPNNVPDIQKKTGLSRFIIHHYLYRRREQFYEYVKENWITFLKRHRYKKMLIFGRIRLPILAIFKEVLTIDKFSLKITVTFIFRSGSVRKVSFSKQYFESIINKEKEV